MLDINQILPDGSPNKNFLEPYSTLAPGGREASSVASHVVAVNEAEIELGFRAQLQPGERCEIGVVGARFRHLLRGLGAKALALVLRGIAWTRHGLGGFQRRHDFSLGLRLHRANVSAHLARLVVLDAHAVGFLERGLLLVDHPRDQPLLQLVEPLAGLDQRGQDRCDLVRAADRRAGLDHLPQHAQVAQIPFGGLDSVHVEDQIVTFSHRAAPGKLLRCSIWITLDLRMR